MLVRVAAALLALALASGCALSPRATASTDSSSNPHLAVSPSPVLPATPVPAGPPASCRLPIAATTASRGGSEPAGDGGFVQLPAGTFSADPQSLQSYDRALGRWLSVARDWVSPDGRRYALPEVHPGDQRGLIHVVDAAAGGERVFSTPAPMAPLAFDAAGVYLAVIVPASDAPPQGLYLLDPATGAIRRLSAGGVWTAVGAGAAYGADLDPSLAMPPAMGPGAANRVRRLDLATGAVSTVAGFPGRSVSVLGLDGAGRPVLAVVDAGGERVSVAGRELYSGPAGSRAPSAPLVADGATLWIGSHGGVLWRSTGGERLAEAAVLPLQEVRPAGACR